MRITLYTLTFLAALAAAPLAQAAWQSPDMPTQQIATAQDIPPVGITATVSPAGTAYFNITAADISAEIARQMELQAVEKKAEVTLAAGLPTIIHSADHPLKLVIHSLQIDTQSKRWQAQAYVVAGGKTETVKPISGTYAALVEVPVLTKQLGHNDIIEQGDLTIKTVPERQLRKDSITDSAMLIGKSPRAVISTNRPIRQNEISSPILIKRGDSVQMTYTNPYISIKASGTALQDGAKGEIIRVKNDKSAKAISGRVQAAGHIEVNNESAI